MIKRIEKLIIHHNFKNAIAATACVTFWTTIVIGVPLLGAHLLDWLMKMIPKRPKFNDPNFAIRSNASWARINAENHSIN